MRPGTGRLQLTGYWLYLRSRRGGITAGVIVTLGTIGRLIGDRQIRLGEVVPLTVPWVVLLPVVAACVVAPTMSSPMTEFEYSAARTMRPIAFAHLAVASALAAGACWWAAAPLPGPIASDSALRNFLGFLGLALLGNTLLGPALAWVPPVVVAVLALAAGSKDGGPRPLAWPIQYDHDALSMVVALILLLSGLMVALHRGSVSPRNVLDE